MPRRNDIEHILIIGSGPIIIGQACEFDYSGAQACKALREEGYRVSLVNSNPATIMTDPEFADATYVEPLTVESVTKIIEREKPDALLPTLGGQTGLNLSLELFSQGVLDEHDIEMIGAKPDAIKKGEDRELFKQAMLEVGLDVAHSFSVHSIDEAREKLDDLGDFPVILRPAYTLGGTGGGIAYNRVEFEEMLRQGLDASPINQVLIEECLLGWKEYEMEVMRDYKDQCVVICSIENFDPMGVHTGDSITIAPAMTLSDKEYQLMRDASFACIREIGVETGGSNIQFATDPKTGRMVVIEMNPRVSRSSALASKATGFPIAKFAAKLAVGYSLDELQNDVTKETPACFEPSIDYVVTKVPRFTFEKFPETDSTLTSAMKSVGEAMAIGRTFKESFQKAMRSLEIGLKGFEAGKLAEQEIDKSAIRAGVKRPSAERPTYLYKAFEIGMTPKEVSKQSGIDLWFTTQLGQIHQIRKGIDATTLSDCDPESFREAKEAGFSDRQLADVWGCKPSEVRERRESLGIRTTFRLVDTCAAEFEAFTPYYYSSYGEENEIKQSDSRKIMILGGGPNRIGQGIEFDYCCVHASFALREAGFETVMVNSNPETVSTDYDTSDRLYFEPLTLEDVLEIYHQEKCDGAIVQYGGQTPLNLATGLQEAGVNVIGTSPESIDLAEDREKFKQILDELNLKQPQNETALLPEDAKDAAARIGYPILLRPSFVLGGRGMFIVYDEDELESVVKEAFAVAPGKPVLLDKFLEEAIELDVDCISDGETTVVGGMLQHIEFAGVHSGDAAMVLPPHDLPKEMIDEVRQASHDLANALKVIGLMNIQFAIKDGELFLIEVNPRASRTVPFVSKAIGVPLAKLGARVMAGAKLKDIGFTDEIIPKHWAIKESVFPFSRFPGSPIVLTPEMRSTGEVMGQDEDFGMAYAKTQMAAKPSLPLEGNVFLSVKDSDKTKALEVAKGLAALGFSFYSTEGTAQFLNENGIETESVLRISEGRPNVADLIKNGKVQLVINTPLGLIPRRDENGIRSEAVLHGVPVITTLGSAFAALDGIRSLKDRKFSVKALQDYCK